MLTQIWKVYIISSKIVNVFFCNLCPGEIAINLAFQHHKRKIWDLQTMYKAISIDELTFVFDWWQLTLVSHWLIIHTLVFHWSIIHLPEGQSFPLIATGATLLGSNPCQHNSHSSNVDTNTNTNKYTNENANTYTNTNTYIKKNDCSRHYFGGEQPSPTQFAFIKNIPISGISDHIHLREVIL